MFREKCPYGQCTRKKNLSFCPSSSSSSSIACTTTIINMVMNIIILTRMKFNSIFFHEKKPLKNCKNKRDGWKKKDDT
ncbi:hypothetical protein DERF_011913 [Dermatophagoides farinae]|uniref:Uncharacterized protein n=1 Tax=Dermatophagoides farinae TaxID=6954 RepID=A0A922HQV6_DERFA|nr:hypothetical protein DERF_011913 [Dermatophagoides farinae]